MSFDGSSQILWFHELAQVSVPAIVIGQPWENVGAWHAREHAAISAQPNYRVDVNIFKKSRFECSHAPIS